MNIEKMTDMDTQDCDSYLGRSLSPLLKKPKMEPTASQLKQPTQKITIPMSSLLKALDFSNKKKKRKKAFWERSTRLSKEKNLTKKIWRMKPIFSSAKCSLEGKESQQKGSERSFEINS